MGTRQHTSKKSEKPGLLDPESIRELDEHIESKRSTKQRVIAARKTREEEIRKNEEAFHKTVDTWDVTDRIIYVPNHPGKREHWHKLTLKDKTFLYNYFVEGKSAVESQAAISPGNADNRVALSQGAARRLNKRSVQEFLQDCLEVKGVTMDKIAERIAAGLDAKKSMYDQKSGEWVESGIDDFSTQHKYIRTAAVMLGVNLASKQEIEVKHTGGGKNAHGYSEEVEDALLEVLKKKHSRKSVIEGEEVSVKVKPNPTQNDESSTVPEKVQGDSKPNVGNDGAQE